MSHRRNQSPPVNRSAFAGYRFPPQVIMLTVRWYLRYGLPYRDVEELLIERGTPTSAWNATTGASKPGSNPCEVVGSSFSSWVFRVV
jgi:hypothetical protein